MVRHQRPGSASIGSRYGHDLDDPPPSARLRRLDMNQTTTVAFLGTGIMGAPMARNCAAAGLDVRAWNRTAEKARALADAGVTPVDAPAEAVRGAHAVVTMLTDGAAVEAVMAGD